jgi:hypothetical protein
MNLRQIYALVIALMGSAIALASTADRTLASEPQMPESFQGTWCYNRDIFHGFPWGSAYRYSGPCPKLDPPSPIEIEITAKEVNGPAMPVSCVVRQVTKFDVCPWGMRYRNQERARALRSFQINPWGPGYHIVLQCTATPGWSETVGSDWKMEKGAIIVGDVSRDYRCPWDRRGAQ